MSKFKTIAQEIIRIADELNWKVLVRGDILTIEKRFEAGNQDQLVRADGEYYSILGHLPQVEPGSTWGTECSGMGALSAMKSGVFRMNKSGGSKRVLRWIEKLQ